MTLAIRYRRVSGESQEENTSLEKQLERMDLYCLANGYETQDELLFTETMTAVETWRLRPQLTKMLKQVEVLAQKHDIVVIFDHPDRAARGLDLILIIEALQELGARVEFVQEKFSDDDLGKIVLHLQSYSSKQEWKRTIKRTRDGRLDRVQKLHKPLGSIPAYGYAWDDPAPKQKNCYVFNETVVKVDADGTEWTERKVVEFMFQQAKEGMTVTKIAKLLTTMGIPTRKGRPFWRESQVSKMLADPIYTGNFYAFRHSYTRKYTEEGGYLTKKKPLEEQYLMPSGTVPAIVDEETFRIVRQQIAYNQRNSTRNNKHPESALMRHLCRCGHCGGVMNVRNRNHANVDKTKYWHYADYFCIKGNERYGLCPVDYNTITTSIVDDACWKFACDIIRDPAKLKAAIQALKTPNPVEQHEKPIAVQKQEIEEQIITHMDMIHTAKTDAGKNRAKAWVEHFETQLLELEQEEKILAGISKNWQGAQDEILRFEQWCERWREKLDSAKFSDKRTAVEYLGIRVTIWKYGVRPRFTMTVAPPNILEKLAGTELNPEVVSLQLKI